MPELNELQNQIEDLIDQAQQIEKSFYALVGAIHFKRGRRRAPTIAELAAAQIAGRQRPIAYYDYVWHPTEEQFEKQRTLCQSYEVWFNASSVLIATYMSNRWDTFASAYPDVKKSLEPTQYLRREAGDPLNIEHVRTNFYRKLASALDRQINLLRAVPAVVRVQGYQLKQSIGAELVGTDLDHAEQLLNMQGTVPSAINRAAGIIAAIALEKHLKLVADAYNDKLPPQEKKIIYRAEDGIIEMANKLKERKIIEPKEVATFKQLNKTRQNCAHVPGDDIKEPTEYEVRFLIEQTRAYIQNIRVQL